MGIVTAGSASASKGAKKHGWIDICKNADGSTLRLPVWVANGVKDGPTLVIDAAAHGGESEGVWIAIELMKSLDPAELSGVVMTVPVFNPIGFDLRMRGNPWDLMHVDVMRRFPGFQNSKSLTDRIVYAYMTEVLQKADYYVGLHGGAGSESAMVPRVIFQEEIGPQRIRLEKSFEMAKAVAVSTEWVIAGKSEHTERAERTPLYQLAEMKIPGVVMEIGGGLPYLPGFRDRDTLDQVTGFGVKSVKNVMKWAGMLEGKPEYPESWRRCPEYRVVRSFNGGILRYNKEYKLNTSVKEGTVVCTVEDLFGEQIEQVKMPFDGIIISQARRPTTRPSESVFLAGRTPEIIRR